MEELCEHILELDAVRKRLNIKIWSEHGEPDGWVNIYCPVCHITFESSILNLDTSTAT